MNIPESNHNAADLGIPYMDTTQNFFRPTPQQRLDFQVRPNENFGLAWVADHLAVSMTLALNVGDLVRLRGREWVVQSLKPGATRDDVSTVELACIADDAQGERLRAVIESEI